MRAFGLFFRQIRRFEKYLADKMGTTKSPDGGAPAPSPVEEGEDEGP